MAQPVPEFNRADYSTGPTPRGVAIGDLNSDSIPDLLVTNSGSNAVTWLVGDGTGHFARGAEFPVGNAPYSVATADFDKNGTLDLAVTNSGAYHVTILLGDGTGNISQTAHLPAGQFSTAIALADLNADSYLDIVTANDFAGGSIGVHRGVPGTDLFASPTYFQVGSYPTGLAVGDLNQDGKLDVAAVSAEVIVMLGDGTGSLGPKRTSPCGRRPTSVAIANLDDDGYPDLVTVNSGDGSVSLLHGIGAADFAPRIDYPYGFPEDDMKLSMTFAPHSLAIGDLTGDGRPDLVVTNRHLNAVTVLPMNASGGFPDWFRFDTQSRPWSVAIADLDGAGLPDLVVTNSFAASVSVLFARTGGVYTSTTLVSDPNVSTPGQTVTLTATVNPDLASGMVEFRDGIVSLGTGTLASGRAELAIANLAPREHVLTAFYRGDSLYRASLSAAIPHTVQGLGSATTVGSSANPSYFAHPVSFTASVVAAVTPGPVPTGTVQFAIDGTNFGSPVSLFGGTATSQSTTSLTPGDHTVQAIYSGDGVFEPSTSPVLTQVAYPPDVEPPVVQCPPDTTLACTPPAVSVSYAAATARDNQDPEPRVSCYPPSGALFSVGTTIVTCQATDRFGNTGSCSFLVTVTPGSCPRDSGMRVDEFGVACANGDSTVQFIELAAVGEDQVFSRDVRLRVFDRFGAIRFDEADLFPSMPNGAPWPVDRRWLLGTNSPFGLGAAPDKIIPPVLDLYGGRISLLIPQGDKYRSVHDVVYGHAGGLNGPLVGHSLQRLPGDSMFEKVDPDPTNFTGATGRGLDCPCPTNVLTGCFPTVYSTDPVLIRYGTCETGYLAVPYFQTRYDLLAGTLSVDIDAPCTDIGAGASVRATDVYYVVGPRAGTPVSLTVNFRLFVNAVAGGPRGGGHAFGSISLGDSIRSYYVSNAGKDTTFRLDVGMAAHQPFLVSLSGQAGAACAAAAVRGFLSFSNLPPGAQVVSCQGFTSDLPVPTLIALESFDARPDRVRLRWYSAEGPGWSATVHRADFEGAWEARATGTSDGVGYLVYEDSEVVPGQRYGYRLVRREGGTDATYGETWVTVPAHDDLRLESPVPNPAPTEATVRFSARGGSPVRVNLIDLAGRQVLTLNLGILPGGEHRVRLETTRVPPGLYFLRLSEGLASRSTKLLVIR